MSEADVLGNDNLFAGLFRGFHLESRLALHITALAALGTQRLEGTHPAFVAGAPRLDALANPHFLLGELLVEQGVGGFLRGQLLFLVHQEAGVIAVPVDQVATVQLQNAGRRVLQEGAVVGDEQHGTVEAGQRFLQPAMAPMSRWFVGSSSSSRSVRTPAPEPAALAAASLRTTRQGCDRRAAADG